MQLLSHEDLYEVSEDIHDIISLMMRSLNVEAVPNYAPINHYVVWTILSHLSKSCR